jgi:large subunit ribosomal protein L30e
MADLAGDIRLAVDSGETAIGFRSVSASLHSNTSKLIIIARKNRKETMDDIMHLTKVSNTGYIIFEGNPMELGAICGKPFSVSVISINKPGNSHILENYTSKAYSEHAKAFAETVSVSAAQQKQEAGAESEPEEQE